MDSSKSEVVHDFHPLFRVYEDGHVERFMDTDTVTPSDDPKTGVQSKDIVISPETNVSVRLFLPKTTHSAHKLPLLIYIHGGAFSIQSPFSSLYHNYLNSLVAEANAIAVSIDYRLAPEHPIPACYDDSWTVMQWVALHVNGLGPEPWLNDHADFGRAFLAGDSAGANIAHDMAVRAGVDGLGFGLKLVGIVLVHPFFGNGKPDKLWMFICPETSGCDDPRLNPAANPSLFSTLGCTKVLVCTAEKDHLRQRGLTYYEALRKSEWCGVVEFMETEGEDHVFHLFNPTCEKAGTLMNRVASFINPDQAPSLL
ncbi:probable carboxylesterase 5 [Cornus florida]|uniref:probable carboxylesterase 5 n=1 Tax=Cornus florida TaxID=4283 RepID=UPI00289B536F|nr:probable carboxylesterase 5 [Cornus florida]XP_059647765.1 probable carboxylesterase 5 [Cornus florida]